MTPGGSISDRQNSTDLIPFTSEKAQSPDSSLYYNDKMYYIATVGDFAVQISSRNPDVVDTVPASSAFDGSYESNTWIRVDLIPYGGGEEIPCDFYTDNHGGPNPYLPGGALLLADTPAGIYEMRYTPSSMLYDPIYLGTLEVLAPDEPKVLDLGGAEQNFGRPMLLSGSSFSNAWLWDLFEFGYLPEDSYPNHLNYGYRVFCDGSIYLSLIAANIKPDDISKVTINGDEVDFSVIPSGPCNGNARQYLLKLDDAEAVEAQLFTVTVLDMVYEAWLGRYSLEYGWTEYYLDFFQIDQLELEIKTNNDYDRYPSLLVQIYDDYYGSDTADLLFEQEVALEDEIYKVTLKADQYLFEKGDYIYIRLCPNGETDWGCWSTWLYRSSFLRPSFPLNNAGTSFGLNWNGPTDILANIDGQRILVEQNYWDGSPLYRPDISFNLTNTAFQPVAGITIDKDDDNGEI